MDKLGTKQLRLELQQPLEGIPADLAEYALELVGDGHSLVFTFDAQRDEARLAAFPRRLHEHGIDFKSLQSSESSLEEIFVRLVREEA